MIVAALARLYDREVEEASDPADAPPPYGWAVKKVSGALRIRDDGTLAGVYDERRTAGKRAVPSLLVVPDRGGRTSGIAAEFLCDGPGYLLGFDGKGNADRARRQLEAARDLHRQVLDDVSDPAARAVLAFLDRWDPLGAAEVVAAHEEAFSGFVVLRLADQGDRLAHEVSALRAAWDRHVDLAGGDVPLGQCLATGEEGVAIALTHPKIKNVQGAQSSGAALVSFNQDAFTSFGKEQNLNAPIGARTAFAYTTALNRLLGQDSERRLRIGDTSVVFWSETSRAAETLVADFFGDAPRDDGDRTARVRAAMLRLSRGQAHGIPELAGAEGSRFHVLGLAPNAARLSIRFWFVDTLGTLLDRVGRHCRDLALGGPDGEPARTPSLWRLAIELMPKTTDGKARTDGGRQNTRLAKVHGDLLRAVLSDGPYPAAVLPLLLGRFRADGQITPARIALLKATINRAKRRAGGEEEEVPMALDEGRKGAYRVGRLLALLEGVQVASRLGDRQGGGRAGPSIADRFIGSAASTPRHIVPYLLRQHRAHLRKLRRDRAPLAGWYARRIEEVVDGIDPDDLPAAHTPSDQGLFYLGYYHQRRFRQEKVAEVDPEAAAAETVEPGHADSAAADET